MANGNQPVKAEEAFGMGQPIEQRIKRVMVDGIPVQVLLLFVGIGLCLTASSDATVPAPVTPLLIAPAPSVVVHDKAGDAAAGQSISVPCASTEVTPIASSILAPRVLQMEW